MLHEALYATYNNSYYDFRIRFGKHRANMHLRQLSLNDTYNSVTRIISFGPRYTPRRVSNLGCMRNRLSTSTSRSTARLSLEVIVLIIFAATWRPLDLSWHVYTVPNRPLRTIRKRLSVINLVIFFLQKDSSARKSV